RVPRQLPAGPDPSRADRGGRVDPGRRGTGRVIVPGALAGGAVGTVVLTSGLRLAQETGVTRMDIPLLLGTAFSEDRRRASLIGYGVHFVNGLVFSLVYAAVFAATGHAGWVFGAGLGFVHALFAGGA